MSEDQVYEGGSKVSVSIWTTARSGPQWKARVTDEADEELIDRTVGRAVRAYNAVERELAALPPFAGSEPSREPLRTRVRLPIVGECSTARATSLQMCAPGAGGAVRRSGPAHAERSGAMRPTATELFDEARGYGLDVEEERCELFLLRDDLMVLRVLPERLRAEAVARLNEGERVRPAEVA